LSVRNYREEDLPRALVLYGSVSDKSLRYARDERVLRFLTHYPGVSEDGIFIAEEEQEIAGLAVVAITDAGELRQGNIIELQAKDVPSLVSLVQAALHYCEDKNLDMIMAVPPVHLDSGRAFSDWQRSETTVMMCKLLSGPALIERLLDNEDIRNSYSGKRLVFYIDGEIVEVEITPESVRVTRGNSDASRAAISVTASAKVLLELAFGVSNPYGAFLTRQVRIGKLKDAPLVLGLLSRIKLNSPMFLPLGDRI
jgi:hypothetical protein